LHAIPQPPQWFTSLSVLTSQPLTATRSQSALPASHVATAHAPFTHAAVAPGRLQRIPHPPQFDASARVFTSQPLAAFVSQSAKPVLHEATVQRPDAQPAVAPGTTHCDPHAPQ
jgi:hypothetical protein